MLNLLQCIERINQFDAAAFAEARVGVEIQDFSSPALLDGDWQKRVEAYRRALEGSSLPVAVHGACIDLNPASADTRIRAITRERYVHSLEIAHRLGASYLIFHSQINPQIRDKRVRRRRIQRQLPLWEELADRAASRNLLIVIENVYDSGYEDLIRLVESLDSPHVQICLDIGHAKVHSDQPLDAWVCACSDYLAFVHVNDNDGLVDQHLSPTEETLRTLLAGLSRNCLEPILSLEYEPRLALREEVKRIWAVEAAVEGKLPAH